MKCSVCSRSWIQRKESKYGEKLWYDIDMATKKEKTKNETKELLKEASATSGYFKREGFRELGEIVDYAAKRLRVKPSR
ncbi:MAG: hypothetical protein AAB687_01495 [Patescibacteria group bacterium]